MADVPFFDRELSWLAFNGRVLQEAADPRVPLAERLGFLAIFSSNLDEFFRVRVAALRALLRLKKKHKKSLGLDPAELLRAIHTTVDAQQKAFGAVFAGLLPALEEHGLALRDERSLSDEQAAYLRDYFAREVRPHLRPVLLGDTVPFLENGRLYLVAELWPRETAPGLRATPEIALVEVPAGLRRFVEVPDTEPRVVLFLDDVVRLGLPSLFPAHTVGDAYAVKLTRDADLNVEDEFSGDLVAKIRKALTRRDLGPPSRFLYDPRMPHDLLTALKDRLELETEDLVSGGRYHNFGDLWDFPRPDAATASAPPLPPLPHPDLEAASSLLDAVAERDFLLHLPYQRYGYVVQLLEEAAAADDVEEIWMSLYRVAKDSALARALIAAAERGKRVTAFVEVKARFDEENNLDWAARMEAAGVRVLYSLPGLKVHAKLALVGRRLGKKKDPLRYTGLFSTGNFNEKTARVYADHVLFTSDARLTDEARRVFAYLEGEEEAPSFKHLLVAPFTLHKGITKRIKREIKHAAAGRPARMTLKMNALEEDAVIARLYEASQAGVDIRLIVRGFSRLVPGVPGLSERIEARSIVDRFLEHARVYRFHHDGAGELFLASADWMHRNLHRRIEVAFPLYDEALRAEIDHVLALQLADDTKARVLDAEQQNAYYRPTPPTGTRAQTDTYAWLQQRVADVVPG